MNAPLNTHTTSPVDPATLTIKPTKETYERLQQAHEHFNKARFGGTLPNALITFQRRRGSFGYFAGARFQNDAGQQADEIALNPMHFASRSQQDSRQFARSDRLKRQLVLWAGYNPLMLQRVEYFDESSPVHPAFAGKYASP